MANLPLNNMVDGKRLVERITQVQSIHAYETLTATKGVQALFREAAIANEKSPGPSRLLVNLALKGE